MVGIVLHVESRGVSLVRVAKNIGLAYGNP